MLEWVDQWMPERIRSNEDLRMRSYLMLSVISCNTLICFVGAILFWSFITLPTAIDWIPHVFLDGGVVGYLLLLVIFRLTGSYVVTSHGMVMMMWLMLLGAIQITGGLRQSVMIELAFLTPAMAFLLTGLRGGIAWLVMTAVAGLISLFAGNLGLPTYSLLPPEYAELFRAALYFVLLLMIGGALMVYELVNQRLKTSLQEEKNRYQHIAALATDSTVVTQSADALALSADSMLTSSVQQKSAIEALVAAAGHLNSTARHNNSTADSAKHAIEDAGRHIGSSKTDIQQLLDAMAQVQASSNEIQAINNVISEIAKQTHLLSLNAMIEAARSSAQGGGFRVVAYEVRRLAESAAQAVQQINALLERNVRSVEESLHLTELMHRRFDELTARITPLIGAAQEIALASHEQSQDIGQIVRALEDMDSAVNENRQRAGETAHLATELRANAQRLLGLVEGT